MTKYNGLTGSMSLCFSCLNIENEKCPKFRTFSGEMLDAKRFHEYAAMFGGVSVQDCEKYEPDVAKLPEFSKKALKEREERENEKRTQMLLRALPS